MYCNHYNPNRPVILHNIENIVLDIITNVRIFKKSPALTLPTRDTKTDTIKDRYIYFGNKNQRRRFALLLHVLERMYYMAAINNRCTVRDLYYGNVSLYKDQRTLETALDEACAVAKLKRFDLSIEASAKGLIAGNLDWVTERKVTCSLIECGPKGMLISKKLLESREMTSPASFILFIEKDAIFQKLLDEDVFEALGCCILITGKGYVDRVTRRLVRKLSVGFKIPTFALVDADPYGIDIAANLKWGSRTQDALSEEPENAFDISEEVVPDLIWLGLRPTHVKELCIKADKLAKLNDYDKKTLNSVLQRAKKHGEMDWVFEMELMKKQGVKAEIEALNYMPRFISHVYLKNKIAKRIDEICAARYRF